MTLLGLGGTIKGKTASQPKSKNMNQDLKVQFDFPNSPLNNFAAIGV